MIDIDEILSELRNRMTEVDTAIHSLELMSIGQTRRGRPPKPVTQATSNADGEPKKRHGRSRKIISTRH